MWADQRAHMTNHLILEMISTNWKKLSEPSGWSSKRWHVAFHLHLVSLVPSGVCCHHRIGFFPSVLFHLLHSILTSACFDLDTWNPCEYCPLWFLMIQQIDNQMKTQVDRLKGVCGNTPPVHTNHFSWKKLLHLWLWQIALSPLHPPTYKPSILVSLK